MKEFRIGNRIVGPNKKPLIIVELGINHKGNIKIAKKIIDSAKRAGAEMIKHQTHLPDCEMSEEAKKITPVHSNESIYKIISDCSLTYDEELKLKKYVAKKKWFL